MSAGSNPIVGQRAGVDRAVGAGAVRVGPDALRALEERVASKVRVRAVLAFEPVGAAQEPDGGLTGRTRPWLPRYGARARARAPARRPRLRATRRAARNSALTGTARARGPGAAAAAADVAGARAGVSSTARRRTAASGAARSHTARHAALSGSTRRPAGGPRGTPVAIPGREGKAPTLDQSKATQCP